jgi:hypothetical protein
MKAKAGAAKPTRRSWLWLQGAACGGLAAVAPGVACILAILLAPALLLYVTEQTQGRPVARTMLLMGAATTFRPLRIVWDHGLSLISGLDLLGDPAVPLLSWTACGAGWLIIELVTITASQVARAADNRTTSRLRDERDALEKEWDG